MASRNPLADASGNPKALQFGDWENASNLPITAYFEGHRKGRNRRKNGTRSVAGEDSDWNSRRSSPASSRNEGSVFGETDKRLVNRETQNPPSYMNSPSANDNVNRRGDRSEYPRRPTRPQGENGNVASPSPHHRRAGTQERGSRYQSVGGNSDESSHGANGNRAQGQRNHENSYPNATIPVFGEWNSDKPNAAQSYTHIFDTAGKVRKAPNPPKITMEPAPMTIQKPVHPKNTKDGGCLGGICKMLVSKKTQRNK